MFNVAYEEMQSFPARFKALNEMPDGHERTTEIGIAVYEFNHALDANYNQLLTVLQNFAPNLVPVLERYSPDCTVGKNIYLGFRRAPAAKGIHHAYEGGLIQHYLEMLTLADNMRNIRLFATLSMEDILFGVFAHDLHKGYAHYHYVNEKLAYSDNYTTKCMKPNQKTVYMLSQCGVRLNELDLNVIFSSEGGYATDAPAQATVLAKFVYLLDEQSVLLDRLRHGKLLSVYNTNEEFFPSM